MRRPLIRHLSEGGGGESTRRQSVRLDEEVASGWSCRDYRRHQSSCDLLKVPSLNPRGRFSPEPRITVTSIFNSSAYTKEFSRMAFNKDIAGNLSAVNATFKWELDHTVINNSKIDDELRSAEFYANNSRWQLCLLPKRIKSDDGFMSIFLCLRSCTRKPVEISFTVSILDKRGQKFKTETCDYKEFSSAVYTWVSTNFAKLKDINDQKNELLVKNKLQISVEITHCCNAYNEIPVNFENLFDSKKFSDVKFSLGDKKYLLAHKNILASQSTVFAAMFEHGMKENIENVIEITDIDHEILVVMVRFMYCGKIDDMANVAQRLLIAADKYDLTRLKLTCGEYLGDSLSLKNAVGYLYLANRYNVNSLEIKAIDFIASNLRDMIDKPEFTAITSLEGSVILKVFRKLALHLKNEKRGVELLTGDGIFCNEIPRIENYRN